MNNTSAIRFVLPTFILVALLTIVPILSTFGLSLTSLSYVSTRPTQYVGFENYERLFEDERFINSIEVALELIIIPVLLQMIIGFVVAVVLSEHLPGTGWLRNVFVAPMVMPPIVMGLMWKVLFTPQLGGVNYFLSLINIEGPDWLSTPESALWAIVIAAAWGWTPFVALMFLSAIETFPNELYEAAYIDGASWIKGVRYITLPLLRSTALVVLVFRIIEALAIFPIIFVVTGGGPASATETINFYAYNQGFNFLKVAYACAIIVIFFLMLAVLTTPSVWIITRGMRERG